MHSELASVRPGSISRARPDGLFGTWPILLPQRGCATSPALAAFGGLRWVNEIAVTILPQRGCGRFFLHRRNPVGVETVDFPFTQGRPLMAANPGLGDAAPLGQVRRTRAAPPDPLPRAGRAVECTDVLWTKSASSSTCST